MPLAEDTVLEDRYRIDGLLAFGGMSAVYRAYDTNLQVDVAIKENYFQTPQAIEQFKHEALVLARLRHPGLPRVMQHFMHEGQQYLVMEFIPGPNLWEMVKQQPSPFPEEQALDWVAKVCQAVEYLHGQSPPIIHRDIKPQNIKVMPDGQVVLVDFGISKEGDADSRTATGARGVTPGFSPPEQYSGGSSPASDVYALGATLYALVTGTKPPDSVSLAIGEAEYVPPNQLNDAVSSSVAEAISRAMQPRPNDRPQTVAKWRGELERLAAAAEAPAQKQPVTPDPALEPVPEPEPTSSAQETEPDETGIECPSCGERNRDGVRFCEDCGSPLEPQTDASPPKEEPPLEKEGVACPSCGERNRPGVSFCEDCGSSLDASPNTRTEEGTTCPSCGAENRTGVRFCEECSSQLPSVE